MDPRQEQKSKGAKWVDIKGGLTEQETILSDDVIFCVKDARVCPLTVQLEFDRATVSFEVDTGATVTILSQSTRQKFLSQICLRPLQVTVQTYTVQPMKVLGELPCTCQCQLW